MKRTLMLFIGLALLVACFSYIIHYRFRDILRLVVERESKGIYTFDADAINISLWKKNISIKNTLLSCSDTLNTNPHYEIKIPEVYLSIQSWKDLLLHKKITVDSLAIIAPHISSHEHFSSNNKPVSFHAANITTKIEKLLQQLQVHAFHITDASFTFSRLGNKVPLQGSNIDFSISNFSKNENEPSRLFSADDIALVMGPQHWVLPDGRSEINFQQLRFSGKNQFFEIDSCLFNATPASEKGAMSLSADKLFFNSKQLSALYEKNALLIDTLICYKPVLNAETNNKTKQPPDSASSSVSKSLGQFFSDVSFKYIDIKDGSLSLINKYRPNYITQKADLKVYNLHLKKDSTKPLTTDSIWLSLKDLQFLTTDSMFQLTVKTFMLHNNDVLFNNAVYAPTALYRATKGFSFIAPALHLRNINLAALIDKKLVADTAELIQPVITVYDKGKAKDRIADTLRMKAKITTGKKKNFYQTLHGLRELIEVPHFNIVHGSLGYVASGASRVKLNMKDLNASILLNKLFQSDSLIDIKRSLPKVGAGTLSIQSPKMNLLIKNYEFKGDRRHNNADLFALSLANGAVLKAKGLYWEVFDWDMFQNHKIIQVDYLKLHELSVSLQKKQSGNEKSDAAKDLPVLHIARFNVDNFSFSNSSAKGNFAFDASDICVDNIGTKGKFFTWGNAEGLFDHFVVNAGASKNIIVGSVHFNTGYGSEVRQVKINLQQPNGYTNIHLPLLKLAANIRSTDFSSSPIQSIEADSATVEIYKRRAEKEEKTIEKPIQIPFAIATDRIIIKNTTVKYTNESLQDTLMMNAKINLNVKDLITFKKQTALIAYDKINIGIDALQVGKGKMNAEVQKSTLELMNGKANKNGDGKPVLTTAILMQWTNAAFQLKQTDSTGIAAENVSGSFADGSFTWYPKIKMQWPLMVNKLTINSGSGYYRGKNITAKVSNIGWKPLKNTLSLRAFSVLPNQTMEVVFSKPGAFQGDYMTIAGEALDISGVQFQRQQGDSLLQVKKIVVDSLSLVTIRDKRMPFKHGEEKLMPVALINTLKIPVRVDSVIVARSKVTVNEIAIKSEKKGTVPLDDINAVITNFTNNRNGSDSLTLTASARLLNYKIDRFYYKEAYGDSLSYFFAGVHVSPMSLPEFSRVTIPLASVGVDRGNADTMFAQWVGNKYAAYGRMNFYYKDLKVHLLNAKDNSKKPFLLSIINAIAPLVLHKNNSDMSQMFFIRDREKFIFNYWVKTVLAGLSTSAGIKRNKKMFRNYKKVKEQYSLPVLYD